MMLRVTRPERLRLAAGDTITVSVRPEDVALLEPGTRPVDDANVHPGEIRDVFLLGPMVRYTVVLHPSGHVVTVDQPNLRNSRLYRSGDPAAVAWNPQDGHLVESI